MLNNVQHESSKIPILLFLSFSSNQVNMPGQNKITQIYVFIIHSYMHKAGSYAANTDHSAKQSQGKQPTLFTQNWVGVLKPLPYFKPKSVIFPILFQT